MVQAVSNLLVKVGVIGTAHAQFSQGTSACDSSGNLISGPNLGIGSGFFKPICPINGTYTLSQLIDTIITYLLYIAGALAVIYLLYAGILYITAGGDEAKATKARTGIVNAVIGIIIIVLAFVIEKAAAGLFIK